MGFWQWFYQNWFDLLQSAGIVASLLFTASALRLDTRTRQVSNLLSLTESHKTLWTEFYRRPELHRILDERAIVRQQEITREEEILVTLAILHLNSTFYAQKLGLLFKLEGLRRDVAWFFSLPIPRMVWEKSKVLQNDDFVEFVEKCRHWK
jgi:hypothetical protein